MESEKIKCSSTKHKENSAISYCEECKIYLCNRCEKPHSELFENHHQFKLDNNISELFTGLCKVENHFENLEFFCKNHNQLCCGLCITKIKGKKYGQHSDCEICFIENIKEEKKNKLNENITILEELSQTLNESINKLKVIFEKINSNKEELKLNIQKIFTKIRNALNDREDKLISEVDKTFDDLFIKEEIIKECEKLPSKIKLSLEKGKTIDKEWIEDNNKLNSLINDCLNVENNIKNINVINEKMKKCNSFNVKIQFSPNNDEEIKPFLEKITKFGNIYYNNNFEFKKCPEEINEDRIYLVSGEINNVLTKTGTDCKWMGTICEKALEKCEEYKWKIKILKSKNNNIMVGLAPNDFDINTSLYNNCGWYFRYSNSRLYSGPPHNFPKKEKIMKEVRKKDNDEKNEIISDEIILIFNIKKRILNFIVNNMNKGQYTDIPIDKPLCPAVFLYHINDSVEIQNLQNSEN